MPPIEDERRKSQMCHITMLNVKVELSEIKYQMHPVLMCNFFIWHFISMHLSTIKEKKNQIRYGLVPRSTKTDMTVSIL